jgi:hypothetical protein
LRAFRKERGLLKQFYRGEQQRGRGEMGRKGPAIERLLKEAPRATGLAAPGMPAGSPGMEMGEDAEIYEVVLFGPTGRWSYGKFKGGEQI